MHAHRHKTWEQATGLPETSARLDHQPEDLAFPDDFPEPIRFDPKRKRLVYRGFMTSTSYAYLRGRSHDLAYLTALDALYQDSAYTHPDAPPAGVAWLWLLVAAGMIALAVAFWVLVR
jgi:hypothetical protein